MRNEGLAKRQFYSHDSHLAEEVGASVLGKSSSVFEFAVIPSTVKEGDEMATNIRLAFHEIRT